MSTLESSRPIDAAAAAPAEIIDDKSPLCLPFILEGLKAHNASGPSRHRPFIVGLNGVQGVGKTTLVKALAASLQTKEKLRVLVVSIDDFYLRHEDQVALALSNPANKLVQCRGEPGTHDMKLASDFFSALVQNQPVKVPQYDKSAFSGQGDRVPESEWLTVNASGQPPVEVIIFEGWCVGFRSLTPDVVEAKWKASSRTLQQHKLEDLLFVNGKLRGYDAITDLFDAFVHIDAENTEWVYDWRLEQEVALRRDRGTGMSDEQVTTFVDAYYPAYELFSETLRKGLFPERPRRQLRLIVSKDRKVSQVVTL